MGVQLPVTNSLFLAFLSLSPTPADRDNQPEVLDDLRFFILLPAFLGVQAATSDREGVVSAESTRWFLVDVVTHSTASGVSGSFLLFWRKPCAHLQPSYDHSQSPDAA